MRGVLGQMMRVPWVQAGLAAWIGLIIITLSSIGPVRIKFYNVFLNCHLIGNLVFMIAIHFRRCMPNLAYGRIIDLEVL
jgi:hypothetical protein